MNKTIEIKKITIRNFILSLLLAFSILFALEHFGKFSYIAESTTMDYTNNNSKLTFGDYVPNTTKVAAIYYETYFENTFQTHGNGFDIGDLNYANSDFDKYSVKCYYYTQATIKDYKYGLFFTLIIFIVFYFFNNFKIKLS